MNEKNSPSRNERGGRPRTGTLELRKTGWWGRFTVAPGARKWLHLGTFDHEAFAEHAGAGFCHHNPFFRGDAEALARGMDENLAQNPEKVLDVQPLLEDGNFVAVHSRVIHRPGDAPVAVFHLFRIDGDHIVELWDVG